MYSGGSAALVSAGTCAMFPVLSSSIGSCSTYTVSVGAVVSWLFAVQ
ncbi:hypothetical protein [Embleya sp. NPDC020886]